jgi:hypothetical protein
MSVSRALSSGSAWEQPLSPSSSRIIKPEVARMARMVALMAIPGSLPMRAAVIALVLACAAAAQTGDSPVIRSTTRLVQVSVLATDKNGPFTGLTKEDFVLFIPASHLAR